MTKWIPYTAFLSVFAIFTYHHFIFGLIITITFLHFLSSNIPQKQILLLITMYVFFYLFFSYSFSSKQPIEFEKKMAITIEILHFPVIDGDLLRIEGVNKTTNEKLLIQYKMKSSKEKKSINERINPYMTCSFNGVLTLPPLPRNENAFDYRRYLKGKKINYIFEVEKWDFHQCTASKPSWKGFLLKIRKLGIEKIEKSFHESLSPLISALIFGEKNLVDENLLNAYQTTGLAHLIAISGLHVGIMTTCLYFFLLRIGMTKETVFRVILIFLPIYVILAGASPSVVRAVMMTWLIVWSQSRNRKISTLDAISISWILNVLWNPYIIYHVGFQLSYGVTFALILSSTMVLKTSSFIQQTLLVTCVAQISSLPLILYHFYEISILSIFLNLLFVPFFSFILIPLTFITFLSLIIIPPISSVLIPIVSFLFQWTNQIISLAGSMEFFTIVFGRPSVLQFIFYFICFIISFIIMEKRKSFYHYCFFIFLPIVIHYITPYFHPSGEVTFIDVGQGDSILIRLPFNQGVYLIDTGGTISFPTESWKQRKNKWNVGKDVVIPFLKSKGIRTIHKLILTHGDFDHIGAAEQIIQSLRVKEVIIGATTNRKNSEKHLIQLAKDKKILVLEAYKGLKWKVKEDQFYILHPNKNDKADNDSSLVLFAKIGGKKWLFTGDIEQKGETEVVKNFKHLKVDYLKVAHHGSDTSTSESFLKYVRPKTAIISCGKGNRYGHPHKSVIERLKKFNISIYRTDYHGGITYQFFRNSGTISTILPYDISTRKDDLEK